MKQARETTAPAKRLSARALGYAAATASGLFASLALAVAAYHLVKESYPDYIQPFVAWLPNSIPADLAIMLAFSAAAGIGFYLLFANFPRVNGAIEGFKPLRTLPLRFTRRDITRAGLVILALWAPIIAISYPTGLTADTFNQLYQFQTSAPTYYPTTGEMVNAEFIDHHPVFDTLLYGLFWQAGTLLGSQDAGVFVLAVLQAAVLAFELATLTCYLHRLRIPFALRLATLVFFAWFPFFGHYAATVLKDTTYLTVFVPWALMWVETARTRGETLDSRPFLIAFMLLGGLCVITKKLGVFVLVASLAVLAARVRGRRLKVVAAGGATLLVFCAILPAVVYPAIGGVAPGGRQEALSPAIQHVTALAHEDADALTDEERAICNNVFNLERATKRYTPFRTDAAKSTFHSDATTDDIIKFLQVWASQGLKHPVTYLVSTLETSGMLFIPFMKLTFYSGDSMASRAENYQDTNPEFNVTVAQPQFLVELNDYLEFHSPESAISDLPLISLFFTQGFYGGWVPFIAIMTTLFACGPLRRRPSPISEVEPPQSPDSSQALDARRGDELCENARQSSSETTLRPVDQPYYLTALAPFAFTVLFLLVSPVASPRYILPLLFTTPLMLGWAWYALRVRFD